MQTFDYDTRWQSNRLVLSMLLMKPKESYLMHTEQEMQRFGNSLFV